MDEISQYDINMVANVGVDKALASIPMGDLPKNLTAAGEHFPWWVWLANTGWARQVSNDGIRRIDLVSSIVSGLRKRTLILDTLGGYIMITGTKTYKIIGKAEYLALIQ